MFVGFHLPISQFKWTAMGSCLCYGFVSSLEVNKF
jgi:hypothetical protein